VPGQRDAGGELVRAAAAALRPIVKRLLAAGVPFGKLESRLRELFVEVAEEDFPLADRAQTDSRIALLTGINRKEVRRIRSADREATAPTSFSRNQAATLISRWLADPSTCDAKGRPRAIPYRAEKGPSFVELVRQTTVDLRPRAFLDELLRTGAVQLDEEGRVVLEETSYVPRRGDPEKLRMLAEDPAELIETMLHNIFADDGDAVLLQRKVLYDNIGSDALGAVRAAMRRQGETFLKSADRRLQRYDRDRNPRAKGGERRAAGVGIYYFEAPHGSGTPREPSEKKRALASRRGSKAGKTGRGKKERRP